MNQMENRYRDDSTRSRPGSSSSGIARTKGAGDDILLITALILTGLGLVMVYSASVFVATKQYQTDWYIFFRQMRLVGVALAAMLAGMYINVDIYRRWIKIGMGFIVILMALQLFTPIGPVIKETRRWVSLGFLNLQTSEVARCMVIVFLARMLTENPQVVRRPNSNLWLILGVVSLTVILTNMQPDLSASLMILMVAGLLLFLGGISFINAGIIGLVAIPVVTLLAVRKAYQLQRLMGFFRVVSGESTWDYQTHQSLIGFGRGGVFGVGLGEGKQKMLWLPEPHTDFIYSIIGEELGLIGACVILTAFVVLFVRMSRACLRQTDRYRFLLGSGIAASLILYAFINMGVATGLLPVTGLPLPFISSGGTSLVVSLWSVGVLWNISRYEDIGGKGLVPLRRMYG